MVRALTQVITTNSSREHHTLLKEDKAALPQKATTVVNTHISPAIPTETVVIQNQLPHPLTIIENLVEDATMKSAVNHLPTLRGCKAGITSVVEDFSCAGLCLLNTWS